MPLLHLHCVHSCVCPRRGVGSWWVRVHCQNTGHYLGQSVTHYSVQNALWKEGRREGGMGVKKKGRMGKRGGRRKVEERKNKGGRWEEKEGQMWQSQVEWHLWSMLAYMQWFSYIYIEYIKLTENKRTIKDCGCFPKICLASIDCRVNNFVDFAFAYLIFN